MEGHFKVVFMLSVILPATLFTSLKLGGILGKQIAIAETITLNQVELEKPRATQRKNYFVESPSYSDGELSANFAIGIDVLGTLLNPMGVKINSTVTHPEAFIESISIIFHRDCQPSTIEWLQNYFDFKNLFLLHMLSGYTWDNASFKEAHVVLVGINNARDVSFYGALIWGFLTDDINQTHQMEVEYKITYYNGTVYKEIIQPFRLTLYAGYHYLKVDAGIWNIGECSVKVLVDGVEYYTPFEIIVSEDPHRIEFEPVIQVNSSTFDFDYWGYIYGSFQVVDSPEPYNVTLKLSEDTHIRAFY